MKRISACIVLAALFCSVFAFTASAQKTKSSYYTYHDGEIVASTPAFILSRVIDKRVLSDGNKVGSIDDIAVTNDYIYLLNTTDSVLYQLEKESYKLNKRVDKVFNPDGSVALANNGAQITLSSPEGVYVSGGNVYVADTGAKRIIVLDENSLNFERVITEPSDFTGDTEFKPCKIAVSSTGNIYFTVSGTTEGIVELDENGNMMRYFGTNTPEYNVIEYFWKSLASDEQLSKMRKTYAPSFCNINIDLDDMVYAVTNDATAEKKIFRFNAKGQNIICERDEQPLNGDSKSQFVHTDKTSAFVDVAVSDYGVYAVLDKSYGRVFIYNYNGYLLNVFSSLGNNYGQLKEPTGIEWIDDDLIISDANLGLAYVFCTTEFGSLMLDAERSYYNGLWDESTEKYSKIIKLNANYYVAYSGLGYSCLMNGKFNDSIKYFKIANDKEGYSKAYNSYRGKLIERYFFVFAIIAVLLIAALIYSEVRYYKKRNKRRKDIK